MDSIQEYLNSIIRGDVENENSSFKNYLKKKTASVFSEQSLSVDFSDTILNIVNNDEKYLVEFKSLWNNNALTEQYSELIKKIIKENDMEDCEEEEVTKAVEELEVEGKKRKEKAKKKISEAMAQLKKDSDKVSNFEREFEVETEDSQGNEKSWTIVAKTESEAEKEAASRHKKQFRTSPKTTVVGKK